MLLGFVSMGVIGVIGVDSLACELSRFFSAVFRKALVVMRSLLLGLQSSADTGVCSQTGQVDGSVNLPASRQRTPGQGQRERPAEARRYSQFSQIICSQQGVLKALTASLLQMAQRSLKGTSSCGSELDGFLRLACILK